MFGFYHLFSRSVSHTISLQLSLCLGKRAFLVVTLHFLSHDHAATPIIMQNFTFQNYHIQKLKDPNFSCILFSFKSSPRMTEQIKILQRRLEMHFQRSKKTFNLDNLKSVCHVFCRKPLLGVSVNLRPTVTPLFERLKQAMLPSPMRPERILKSL